MIHVTPQAPRIAFVNQPWNAFQPPVQSGSIAIWTDQVSRCLSRKYALTVYARRVRPQASKLSADPLIRYRFFDMRSDLRLQRGLRATPVKRLGGLPSFASWWHYLIFALKIAIDLRHANIDLVHIHNLTQFVPIVRLLNPRIKIILHMHCEWLSQLDPRIMERRIRQCNLLLGCSHFIASRIRRCYPHSRVPVKTIANGVAPYIFKPGQNVQTDRSNGPKRALFVGRISPEKGLHLLIDAFIRVASRHPEFTLQIVGPYHPTDPAYLVNLSDDALVTHLKTFSHANYLAYLRQQVPEALASRIEFCGPVDYDRLPEYYQHAEFLISPSLSESFGMSLIEAMACGLPVIASRVGGMPFIVEDNVTGLLVRPGDPGSLAEAMNWILTHHQASKKMGVAARRSTAYRFGWERISRQLDRLYQSLITVK